jgi:hypothetical protein
MAVNEPTGDVELSPNNSITTNEDLPILLPEVSDLLFIPDPLSPNTIQRCQRRLTNESKSRIEAAPTATTTTIPDPFSSPPPEDRPPPTTRLSRRQRKMIDYKEVEDSPRVDYGDDDEDGHDAVDTADDGDDRSTEKTAPGVKPARKTLTKKPRHARKKKRVPTPGSAAAVAVAAGPSDSSDGTEEDIDNDPAYEVTTSAVSRNNRTFHLTKKTSVVPPHDEDPNQQQQEEEPFNLAPPPLTTTLMMMPLGERQSSFDELIRDALPLTLSPGLTDWYQKGILTDQSNDVALTAIFDHDDDHNNHRHSSTTAATPTTARSAFLDHYRAIVRQWPPLAVQINNASIRTEDGRIIAPPLLPPSSLTTTFDDAVLTTKLVPPDDDAFLRLESVGSVSSSTHHKQLPAEELGGRCRSKLDRMQAPGAYPRQVDQLMHMHRDSINDALEFIRIPDRAVPTVLKVRKSSKASGRSAGRSISTGMKRTLGKTRGEPLKRSKSTPTITKTNAKM